MSAEAGSPAAGAAPDDRGEGSAPEAVVRFVSGAPTDEELAAVQAVLGAVLAEQAALGAARKDPPVDLWRRAARAPRTVIRAGTGAWIASRGQRGC